MGINSLRNQFILVSVFLIVCSYLLDSPFRKGGIEQFMPYVIYFTAVSITFLYFSTLENTLLSEKILYSVLLAFFALFASFLISHSILEKMYGYDYQLFQSNTVANLIFYFITDLFLILSVLTIRKLKKNERINFKEIQF